MDLQVLQIGLSVNIKRSNGRIHAAAISGIDTEKQYVSVEWFENGETKGKEIEFNQVYALNAELFAKPIPHSSSRKTIGTPAKPRQNQLQPVENVVNSPKHQPKAVAAIAPRARQNIQDVPPPSRGGANGGNRGNEREEEPRPAQPPPPAEKKPPAPKAARKSNVVKEIEKLKKNRDDRRARQAGQLAQRNEMYDTSSPHWEFYQKIREFRAKLDPCPLVGDEPVAYHQICVCVRKRPLNKKELTRKEVDVITVADTSSILVHEPKVKVDLTKYLDNQNFCFDYSFDENTTNDIVYRFTAQPLVHTIFDRGMATCFAYGQTGSGKTHTMGGVFIGKEQDASKGIYIFAAADVFHLNSLPDNEAKGLDVSASFFEIYSGKVFDLLNRKRKLRILEDAKQQVQVVGLTEEPVDCVEDVLQLIQRGTVCRTSGTTSANQHSSRSHAVFQIILRKRSTGKLYGKFSLIDLAGNERGADTASSDRQTRMEGAEINKSLLALKECIRALGRKGAHLPFRGSKLTQVLKDSFVGDNSRTCMIAMISPGFNSCEHTLNTLRYADRVKELRSNHGGGGGGGGVVAAPKQLPPKLAQQTPIQDDLQFLHLSLQQEGGDLDKSSELLTFHEAICNLVESEEQLTDEHRAMIQEDEQLLEEEKGLLEYCDDVDRDIEEYVRRLKSIMRKKMDLLTKFNERIEDLSQRLQDEEKASKNMKHIPPFL